MTLANASAPRPLNQFLRMAVMAGVESAVQIHIDRGDDLDARDGNGMTPLMLSAARNKPAVCELLLSAGANPHLLDPAGRTAHSIAVASGASEVAVILLAILASTSSAMEPIPDTEPSKVGCHATSGGGLAPCAKEVGSACEPPSANQSCLAIDVDEAIEFDLSGWDAEEEALPPQADLSILIAAGAVQRTITTHDPIDSSMDWDDIDAFLPERAWTPARANSVELRNRFRRLLLRAIREGSVPGLEVEELSINDDRSANPGAEMFLAMVVNDLGAEVDERVEYLDAFESFDVFVAPEETPDEEVALDEALAAIDSAASSRHEPLRIYQRDFQRLRLLTTEEEVALARAMESDLGTALDALAAWPNGVVLTLAAGAEVKSGSRPLTWMSDGGVDSEFDIAAGGDHEAATSSGKNDDVVGAGAEEEGDFDSPSESPEHLEDTGFANSLAHLASIPIGVDLRGPDFQKARQALTELNLSRQFLLELADVQDSSTPAVRYKFAMKTYRKARDQMTVANLKLAFYHAKKYLHSGEPLDDLAQEANIGLLKAVDRFDWRRGYKFSTYATWWIRQQIGRHVADRGRTIRVPVHVHEKSQRLRRELQALESEFGRDPTCDELAFRMEMPADKVAALLRIAPEPLPIHELPVDEMIAIDARHTFAEPDPADIVEAAELRAAVNDMLSSLPSRDQQIVRLRFGIGIYEALTLDEVGQRYALTRERIRQIEAKALTKLRHSARAESFARLALGRKIETSPSGPISGALDPSRLDWLLAHAVELGIPIDDDRSGSSGRILVHLVDPLDSTHRSLAKRLLEFGFAFSPAKGYWL